MNYATYVPPDSLKLYVKYFWSLESSADASAMQSLRTMADGCPGIVFQQSGGNFYRDGKQLPQTFLYGQSTTYGELSLLGNFDTVGVYFYPSALKLLFNIDAHTLTDTCLDLDAEARKRGFWLSEQLAAAPSVPAKIAVLSAYLFLQSESNNKSHSDVMRYALSEILKSHGTFPLKDLRVNLRMSERSFERRFKEYVGISPRLFSRICRFQASLTQMRNNNYDKLSDIAFENDYADQSHFIRTFKEFTGFSPNQYQLQSSELVENLSQIKK
jgi:AraC-like DNA-binding protein